MFKLTDIELLKLNNEVVKLATLYPNACYKGVPKEFADACELGPCCYSMGEVIDGPENPGCIIGQAFRSVFPDKFEEISSRELGESEKAKEDGRNCGGILNLLSWPKDSFLTQFIQSVQRKQDSGYNWGRCVDMNTTP